MKKICKKTLASTICLAMFALAPALVTATDGVTATSIGASVQNAGDDNVAVGSSILVVNGDAVLGPAYGALVVGGSGNTAIGVNAQTVYGNDLKAIGYGAAAGYGNNNTAIGNQAFAGYGDFNSTIGTGASAGGGYDQYGNQVLSNQNVAVGYQAQAYGGNSVAIGANSIANEPNTVSVGHYGEERRITNVAPGTYGTDAVNMNQLWNTGDKVNRVGAVAMAMSGLAPMGYNPKEPTQYAVAIGTYGGRQGYAVGVYHYTHDNVMLNAAFGTSTDRWEQAGRAGITWWPGSSKDKDKKVADNTVFASNVPTRAAVGNGAIPANKPLDTGDTGESLFMQTLRNPPSTNNAPVPAASDMKAKVEDKKTVVAVAVPVSKPAATSDIGIASESLFMQTLKKPQSANNVPAPVVSDTKVKAEDKKTVIPVSKLVDTDDTVATSDSLFMQTLKKGRA